MTAVLEVTHEPAGTKKSARSLVVVIDDAAFAQSRRGFEASAKPRSNIAVETEKFPV